MFPIRSRKEIAPKTVLLHVEAPLAARKIEPGQFVIVRVNETGERIPLSISGWDRQKGTIRLVVQGVGRTSYEILDLQEGQGFQDVVGPLGKATELKHYGTCVLMGGGYGAGAIIPMAERLKELGNTVIGILGARTSELLIMTEELKQACHELRISTNDGSRGVKGMVTDVLSDLVKSQVVNFVIGVGPIPMMAAISEMTRPFRIPTHVSLNALMMDGIGMCGACRVTVGGKSYFACVDGPEFDGHQVDFDEIAQRLTIYREEEKIAADLYLQRKETSCRTLS
ncbi:MAG TPA: sulfide/dihydroorotate dehydrogenase-like FAD/NAD-binding protein [bacterium]|nr:sulfide/dihydroorotate dehydrogenase-like FAD/NAD-binding protein [bacterium]